MNRRALAALAVLGLAAAGVVLVARVRLEVRYRTVEIVLDGDDWTGLIRREGREAAPVLRLLRERGATSVALGDNTLKRLAEEGLVSYASGGALIAEGRLAILQGAFARLHETGRVRTDAIYVAGPPEQLEFVATRLRALLGASRVRGLEGVIEVLGAQADLEEIGLGFRPADAARYQAAGLGVVLRPRNYRGLTAESLLALVATYAQTADAPTLIFALTEVQGHEALIDEAAEAYRRVGARFGRIEVFTERRKQRGEDRLTARMRPDVIRVFSITPEELQVLRPRDVADRFVRAAQERNIRLMYVRPLLSTPAGVRALDVNVDMVGAIADDLRGFGFGLGRARPLPSLEVPRPLIWLVAAGACALAALVLDDVTHAIGLRFPRALSWIGIVLGALATVIAGLTRFDGLWRQVLALGVAIVGASGAAVWALPQPRTGRFPVGAAWGTLVRAIGLSVAGGLLVAALLSQWPFMLAFSVFLGVKAAHVVPVLLVAVWVTFRARGDAGWQTTRRELALWIQQPLRLGTALGVVVLGLAAVMLLARTGNVGIPLVGVEQALRSTLEDFLVARPRTKEFLLGYPVLVLAGFAAARGWRKLSAVFATAGAVGTTGAINSFSHLHTPLLYTAWRTANALALGAVLAIPAVVVLLWISRRFRLS